MAKYIMQIGKIMYIAIGYDYCTGNMGWYVLLDDDDDDVVLLLVEGSLIINNTMTAFIKLFWINLND